MQVWQLQEPFCNHVNFTLESEDLPFLFKWKKWFLWTMATAQHKQLKTMEMSELHLILSMRDIYISSNQNPLTKFTSSSRSTKFKDVLPWNISQLEFTKQAKVPNKHSVVQFDLIIQIVEIFLDCRH